MIAIIIFSNIIGLIFEVILNIDLDIDFELFNLIDVIKNQSRFFNVI